MTLKSTIPGLVSRWTPIVFLSFYGTTRVNGRQSHPNSTSHPL